MVGKQKKVNWLIILLLFIPGLLFGQEAISIQHGTDYDPALVSPVLHRLQQTNDYVISFRTRFTNKADEATNYFILTANEGKLSAYTYLANASKLQELDLPSASLELGWKTFVQNGLFEIRDEKEIPNFCPEKYHIYNSYTYEFIILSKGKMKRLSYYSPEYYDNACYGMEERKKIINSVSVVNYMVNNK